MGIPHAAAPSTTSPPKQPKNQMLVDDKLNRISNLQDGERESIPAGLGLWLADKLLRTKTERSKASRQQIISHPSVVADLVFAILSKQNRLHQRIGAGREGLRGAAPQADRPAQVIQLQIRGND